MNVPLKIISWIRSLLFEREQRVMVENCVSSWQTLNGGVLQGTTLRPALFLVMINDLILIDWNNRWKYVDGNTITESISSDTNSILFMSLWILSIIIACGYYVDQHE